MAALFLFATLLLTTGPDAGLPVMAQASPGRDRKPLAASKVKKLRQTFLAYGLAANPKTKKKAWSRAKRNAGKLNFEQLEALLAALHPLVPRQDMRPGYHHDLEFEFKGETWLYSVHLPTIKKGKRYPLVLDPGHASSRDSAGEKLEGVIGNWLRTSGAEKEVIYIRTRALDRLVSEARYDKALKKKIANGEWSQDTIVLALEAAVRDACRRFPVDSTRVYSYGFSMTGYWAWFLGCTSPHKYAAVAPMAAVTWHVRRLLSNCLHLPVLILHGTADKTCPYSQAKAAADELAALGAPVELFTVEGGPHTGKTFGRWGKVWASMKKKIREPYPKKIQRKLLSGEVDRIAWLQVGDLDRVGFQLFEIGAEVAGEIDGQTVRIHCSGVKQLAVWLSTKMLDLSAPIAIEVNGKRLYSGNVRPQARAALDRALQDGDTASVYSSVVLLKVR